jgi:hypothetical protein
MKKIHAILLIAILPLFFSACNSDTGDETEESGASGASGGSAGSAGEAGSASDGEGTEIEQCLASVEPTCSALDRDTGEKMEIPCFDLTFIPIPLSNGGNYGPVTLEAGPYGGKIEWNEGAGTEFVNPVNGAEPVCLPFGVETFREPASVNADMLNTRGLDYSLYTIFRPACMKEGEKYPVITWANGTCGLTHGYAPLLATVASHGFVIFASNSSWTGTPPTDKVQLRALDYAAALNEDPDSIYYQRLDLDKIGAMGHSQGAGATRTAASDPRIKALIMWNGGTSNDKPFLYVSGDRDLGGTTAASLANGTNAATQPGAWIFYHQVLETGGGSTGHLVLMEQPDRVVDMAIAWWQYMLNGDEEAKKMFVGDDCGLCNRDDEFEYGHNDLLQ